MRFQPELTLKVQELILERGRTRHAPLNASIVTIEPEDCTPELRAIIHRAAPMAEALFLMTCVDGVNDEVEHTALRGALRLITDDALPDDTIDAMLAHFADAFADEGLEARLESVAAQIAADRVDGEVVVELAAAAILADRTIDSQEREVLELLAEEVGVDPRRVRELVD